MLCICNTDNDIYNQRLIRNTHYYRWIDAVIATDGQITRFRFSNEKNNGFQWTFFRSLSRLSLFIFDIVCELVWISQFSIQKSPTVSAQ